MIIDEADDRYVSLNIAENDSARLEWNYRLFYHSRHNGKHRVEKVDHETSNDNTLNNTLTSVDRLWH